MNYYKFIWLLFCSIFFIIAQSCNQVRNNNSKKTDSKELNSSNKVSYANSDTAHQYDCTEEVELLKLDKIDSGYIGNEFRIWMQITFSDSTQILVIKNLGKTWTGEFYYLMPKYKNLKLISIGNYRKESRKPKSVDSLFTKMIDISDVFNFKTYQDIHGYSVCNDGDVTVFEMANKKGYKKNIYPCLHANRSYSDEARKVWQFIFLIKKEFELATIE